MKNNIKTMRSRQQITDDEIKDYMNFDAVLDKSNKVIARNKAFRFLKRGGIVTSAIIAVVATIYFIQPPVTQRDQPVTRPTAETSLPVPVDRPGKQEDQQKSEPLAEATRIPTEEDNKPVVEKGTVKAPAQIKSPTTVEPKERQRAQVVYTQAEPLNGYPDLYAYFEKSLVYPQASVKDSIQGTVTVLFSINEVGKPQDVKIENSLGAAFDKEVVRLVMNMPPWKPATYNGKFVTSKISLPLTFEVKKLILKD